jgi:GNAT superfamily N-acetyltransferase
VQKVLVLSEFRRRGVGRLLMQALDDEARRAGRTLLVLDTERGSGAEMLYEQMGYQRAGIIPGYALNHDGTRKVDTVLFYRELR